MNEKGFSLIELMIAMSLGLIISGSVISMFISSQQNFQILQVQLELQENANFTFNYLNESFKKIGFSGHCERDINVANTIEGNAFSLDKTVQGYEIAGALFNGSGTESELPNLLLGRTLQSDSDIISMHLLDDSQAALIDSHNPNASSIHTRGNLEIEKGDFVAVVNKNCSNMALFVQTGNGDDLNHNPSNGQAGDGYNNCISKLIGGDFDCTDTSNAYEMSYQEGSSVYKFEQSILAILPSSFNAEVGSLYRVKESRSELVYGIKSMQFEYGMGVNDGAGGLRVSQYLNAREVSQWQNVIAINVILTMMSTQMVDGVYPEKQFKSVFSLRNRVI